MPTLHWIGKDKVINHHQDVPFRILEKQYTFSNGEQTPDGVSENKIIHGDNLEALKSLLPEYEGKIKCIYIDPPYNTGNEGWVYNDNVNDPKIKKWLGQVVGKESEDLSRHDKWLCMMYPRLKLLHKLLADDGAIFISIDDNEQANLKLICDEIFGESNLVGNIVWQRTFASKNDAKFYSSEHEYILNYSKNIQNFRLNNLPRSNKQNDRYKNPDNDFRGDWTSTDLLRMEHRDNSIYTIISPSGASFTPKPGTSWRHPEKEMLTLIANNEVYFGPNGTAKPRRKRFLKDVKDGIVAQTIWKHDEVGHTQEAKQSLKKILDESNDFFATPKTVGLVDRILKIASKDGDIILDSFAGSGTTAHAVLNLNKEDNGNRKFILIEMEDYAEDITAERVKRVIKGYGSDNKSVEGTGGSFSYYKLDRPIFLNNDMLNEEIGVEKIGEYVWYSETKLSYTPQEEKYLLGKKDQTAYYFYYNKSKITTLDESFLRTLKTKASQYIIYADNCLLNKELMQKYDIIFKKIPRDITRF
ncbi:site-specific DNA-methyltransferase [Kaistella sp.]|uniref:site-specific DNA-methyltransferase n=1 Tax=Kaistella sp. TaxID=2782235 RepID=UPI002F95E4CC